MAGIVGLRPFLLFGWVLVGCAPSVPSPSSEDGSSSSDSTGSAPETSTGADASSSSSSGSSTGSVPLPHCGDAVVDEGEACDDGNPVEADGCNTDCTLSGSLLWQHELPSELDVRFIAVDHDDAVHVLAQRDLDVVLVTISSAGTHLGERILDAPVDPPRGTREVDRSLDGFALLDDGTPVYNLTDAYFDGEGFTGVRGQLRVDQAWSHDWDPDSTFRLDAYGDHIVGMGLSFHAFSTDGTLSGTGPGINTSVVVALPDGGAFARKSVVVHDLDGGVRWSDPWPGDTHSGASALTRTPRGDLVVGGEFGDDSLTARQLRLARYGADGTLLDTWTWPDRPGDVGMGLDSLTATPQGHLAFAVGQGKEGALWKLDSDFSPRWQVPLDGIALRQLRSDARGALLYFDGTTIGKFAP